MIAPARALARRLQHTHGLVRVAALEVQPVAGLEGDLGCDQALIGRTGIRGIG